MDGRPHPPEYAAHTWQGFSTGKWDGDMLTVTTTHLKMGWIRRNGVPRSDKATLTEHFVRHGDYLTLMSVVNDPVYLTEPFVRTTNWALDPHQTIAPYPCEAVVEVERPQGLVPSHLPGTNTFLREFASKFNLPFEPTRGGAETMYPEYATKIADHATCREGQGSRCKMRRHMPKSAVASVCALAALVCASLVAPTSAQNAGSGAGVHTLHVQGNVYMLVGAGGNITRADRRRRRAARGYGCRAEAPTSCWRRSATLADKPIRYIINTQRRSRSRRRQRRHRQAGQHDCRRQRRRRCGRRRRNHRARERAEPHERADRQAVAVSDDGMADRYVRHASRRSCTSTAKAIEIDSQAAAHTDGDSHRLLPQVGCHQRRRLFVTTTYPGHRSVARRQHQGRHRRAERHARHRHPEAKQEGGTYIIPGHGRLTRRSRSARLPRHGDDHSRSRAGPDQARA